MQASSHVEDVIAAFYARVMQRVCVAYKELDARSNADVAALVEQVRGAKNRHRELDCSIPTILCVLHAEMEAARGVLCGVRVSR